MNRVKYPHHFIGEGTATEKRQIKAVISRTSCIFNRRTNGRLVSSFKNQDCEG